VSTSLTYLLDTNILSDLVRNPQGVVADQISKAGENSIASRLYTGYCYKMLGQFDAAEKEFKYIINNNNNLFIDQAEWSLASVYLESGNINDAKSIYKDIANKNGSYKKKARKILEELSD